MLPSIRLSGQLALPSFDHGQPELMAGSQEALPCCNAGFKYHHLSTLTRNTAIYSGDGLKKISRTSTCPCVAATPSRPCRRLIHVSAFQYPKTAYVFLGLKVWPVSDEDSALGLRPQSLVLCVKVVEHDLKLLGPTTRDNQPIQKRDDSLVGVLSGGNAAPLAGLHIQRLIRRQLAVTVIP